jgi:energy-coupling factor transport system ATP-binding protein
MLLIIENLTFAWQNDPLFYNINCSLESGEIVLLKGENGSGKSTLLQLISGMIPHFSRGKMLKGDVKINGRSITKNPPKQFFPHIAFVPASNIDFFLLNGNLSEEIALAQGILDLSTLEVEQRINDCIKLFPEIIELRNKDFTTMTAHEKILSLVCIYYTQCAKLYLFDEILNIVPQEKLEAWFEFYTILARKGCGVLLTAHRFNQHNYNIWEIQNNSLITA